MISVEDYLASHSIAFKVHEHSPVQTCDELAQYGVPGLACKNLFLRDQKKRRYFLVILPAEKMTDLLELGESLGERKLSFVNPKTLKEKLGVEPGAVSPFGLLNNSAGDVEVFVDREVMEAGVVHFHPNRNTASLELTGESFKEFLKGVRNRIVLME